MKSKRAIALMWIFAVVPLILVFFSLPFLPEMVPTNWGLDGEVTYSGKNVLWVLAISPMVISALYQVLPHIDPKKKNYERFQNIYDTFGVVISLFFLFTICIMLTESFRPGSLDVGRVTTTGTCIFFLLIGNMMGKVKSNWFMGFRTPWALDDPDVWNKTQRMGGWTLFLSGLITLPLALLAPEKVYSTVFFILILGGVVLTSLMSWHWYRERHS